MAFKIAGAPGRSGAVPPTGSQCLAPLRGPVDQDAIIEMDLGTAERFPNHLVHARVLERHSFDKVAPFVRWAVASTTHIRQEDRLSHVAAVLPANLIGAHAVSHLTSCDELVVDGPHRWRYYWAVERHPSPIPRRSPTPSTGHSPTVAMGR
jgi:hypothetical protein